MNKLELKRFPVTYALLAINILVFLYTTIRYSIDMDGYQAINAGAFMPVLVVYYHQIWRMITANFVHFGILHILCNMISLYNIGFFVESSFKRNEYLTIILTSMITTNLLGLILYMITNNNGFVVSGGFSGVIFGLLGAIIVLGIYYKGFYGRVLRSLMPSIILMLVLSFTMTSISLSGHIGGLLGGMISTYIIVKRRMHYFN